MKFSQNTLTHKKFIIKKTHKKISIREFVQILKNIPKQNEPKNSHL